MAALTAKENPHTAELKVLLKTVAAVLDASRLPWHITGGTLLTECRSRGSGFIPWDTDIDLAVAATNDQIRALSFPEFKLSFEGIWRVYAKQFNHFTVRGHSNSQTYSSHWP